MNNTKHITIHGKLPQGKFTTILKAKILWLSVVSVRDT